MCPACIATGAWIVAGATSAGGLTVFVAKKLRATTKGPGSRNPSSQGLTGSDTPPDT